MDKERGEVRRGIGKGGSRGCVYVQAHMWMHGEGGKKNYAHRNHDE